MKKIRGAAAEAAAGVAIAVHELERRIGVGVPVRRVESPAKDQARHLVDQLLLGDRMGVSVLVVVAYLQIVYKTKTFPASITPRREHILFSLAGH